MAKKAMNPLSKDLGNALLARHRDICSDFTGTAETVPPELIKKAILSYTELLRRIGAPESLAQGIGRYLEEVAAWCASQPKPLPPINALAVNGDFDRPGPGYYTAPGCGDWDLEVRQCIACRSYPRELSI